MKKFINLFILTVLALPLAAQQADAGKELEKIKSWYAGPQLKHVAGQMLLTNTANGKQVDKVDFEYWIRDKQVFTKMNYIEILCNNSVYVMVNHRRRSIYARPLGEVTPKTETPFFDGTQLNELLNAKGTTVTLVKQGHLNKLLMAGLNDSRFSSISISYDAADGKIKAVEAAVKPSFDEPDQRLLLKVIYRISEKTAVTGEPAVFSAAKYMAVSKGEFIYNKMYQEYKKL